MFNLNACCLELLYFQDKQMKIKRENDDKELLLYDEERDNKYPVFEDFNGTHIMSPNDICN